MTALELIARLRDKGIRIAARDGELELDAPKGALDDELRDELRRRKPELLRLLSWSRRAARDLPLQPADRKQRLPLSWAQQRLWFLDQLEPSSSAYNISWTVRLRGELDTAALQAALTQLIARHETLRTTFPDKDGEASLHIAAHADIALQYEKPGSVSDEQLRAWLGSIAAAPFDLATGPLMRVVLIRLTEHEHILLVVIHHIVADGASMRVLFRELATLYEAVLTGAQPELAPLPVQYADYAVWQRQWLDSEELLRQTDYWLEQLRGLPPLLELPADRPRSAAMRYRGASVLRVLPKHLADDLRALGRQHGCTLFMVMLAAFYVLLKRYSGRDDLVVGTPMGGRPRSDLEGLIGFFINTVVLRADLDGDPAFGELLHQVREVALGAHANQELPFEKLVEVLQPQRELSYSPVFQIMFDLQEEPRWRLPVKNLEVVPEVVFSSRTSSFDLTLSIRQAENGLDAMFEYDTDLFDESSIEQFASHYQALLEEIVADPARPVSQFSLTDRAEQQRIVTTWGPVAAPYPATLTLQALFEAQVVKHPDAVALVDNGVEYSYAGLNRCANRLAHRLQALGALTDQPVAVAAARTAESFIAVLAVLKSGACVLPLDTDYPLQRLQYMLHDAGAALLLVPPACGESFAGLQGIAHTLLLDAAVFNTPDYPDENVTSLADGTTPAYLMYTSGTTGQPKGVALAHGGLVNYIHQLSARTEIHRGDRVLQFASPGFDIAIEESFAALMNGATLVLRESSMHLSVEDFLAGCKRHAISWLSLPTAWWHELCYALERDGLALPESLHTIIIGGEKARLDAFALWQKQANGVRLFNTYGPTETSIVATWYELTHLDAASCKELPIGHPVPNTCAWVLDEQLRPLPVGVPGELYIGGVGVAAGYWRQPELTAAKFLPDPFSDVPGAQLYRSGDRARYLADGRLVYLGRTDSQVKLRGYRIEPGEIEAALAGIEGVRACVVVLRDVVGDGRQELSHDKSVQKSSAPDKRLAAYVVSDTDSAELQRQLKQLLPEYMVPAALVKLDSIPMTVNGKVDYQALPEPAWLRDETQVFIAPRTDVERRLAGIWAAVLGIERVGVQDDFFALGGHSLLATRVVSRIRDEFSSAVPLRKLFDAPTVAGLAAIIAEHTHDARGDAVALRRHNRVGALLPLSWAQQRLWVLDQLEPNNPAYNLPWVTKLSGELNVPALQLAVDKLVERHESLRTGFGSNAGEPVQLIAPTLQVPVQTEDWHGASAETLQARLRELTDAAFDLHTPPLLRVTVLQTGESEAVLLVLLHHIVADGWSVGVLLRELAHYYNEACTRIGRDGKPTYGASGGAGLPALPGLPELPVQYADYAIWQREWLTGAELLRQQQYWTTQLANVPPVLELPLDHPRPPVQSFRGAWVSQVIAPALLEKLQSFAAAEGATLFMVLLTAFKALLAVQSGRQDVVVGTPVAGRQRTELEGLIGCFLNTLVLRTQFNGNPSFTELLQRVRQTTLAAYDHQELPFEKLLELLQPERSTAYTPVVQVMFNLQNTPSARMELAGLELSSFDIARDSAKFDLSASLVEGRDGLRIGFEYNTDLFSAATANEMLAQYVAILKKAAADPQLSLARLVRTRTALVPVPQQSAAEFPAEALQASIGERFADMVARYPERLAVQDTSRAWTYRELAACANAVAQRVHAASGGEPMNIGLLLGHDAVMVAGLLGVLQAGCAYVPLDRRVPLARTRAVIADAGISVLLTDAAAGDESTGTDSFAHASGSARGNVLAALAADQLTIISVPSLPDLSIAPLKAKTAPDSLAYILFTSGTTGKPKGVTQTHRNVLHHARTYSAALHINERDRLSLLSGYGFDAAVMDIFGALLNGASLFPLDLRAGTGPAAVIAEISAQAITVLHATPTALRFLLADHDQHDDGRVGIQNLRKLRALVLGGEEALPGDFRLFKKYFPDDALFVNGLGPSESTTALQFFADRATQITVNSIPVGLPVNATEIVLLDPTGQESGISGELCIRSAWVSPGYWRQPELTADRFITDSRDDPQLTLYRSGDGARYLPDGQLLYTGRLDQQLKIRGHRVESAEIEIALASLDGVQRCAVMLQAKPAANGQSHAAGLVAYVQGAAEFAEAEHLSQLRTALASLLPDYMLPEIFMHVADWPLMANGKLDRHALPLPTWKHTAAADAQGPRTETEQKLHAIWADVLGMEIGVATSTSNGNSIDIHADFFAIGGHSLLATRVVARIRDVLGAELMLRDLFANPTIASLALVVEQGMGSEITGPVLRAHTAGDLPPLSWAQQRLWFLDQLEPENTAYNLHWAARIDGFIGVESLQLAVDALVARHESLRTTFGGAAGQPVQIIAAQYKVKVQVETMAGAGDERLHARLLELIRQPFDLQAGPLLRVNLLHTADNQAVLLLQMHHIVSDGWSMSILFRELAAFYTAAVNDQPAQLPALPVQYADFAVWQRAWLSGGELERQEAYWKAQLTDAPPLLDLPLDHVRPPVQRFRGAWVSEKLPAAVLQTLRSLATGQGATLFMVLLAAFKMTIARHTGRVDILVGSPIAGRRRTELEGLIGFFLNTLVLRTDLGGNPSFTTVLERVRQTTLGAYDHQELPFEKLLEILQPVRSAAYTPVVQVTFNLHNEPGGGMHLDDTQVTPFSVDRGTAKFDLAVALVESRDGLQIGFEYNTDLFNRATVAGLLHHFSEILAAVAQDPALALADLPLSAAAQVPQPPQEFAAFPAEAPGQSLTARFAEMVAQYAERPAVCVADISWSYRELNACADVVAARINAQAAPGARVGLLLGHDAKMLAGLLGVLKAGCAYVPLDHDAPAARSKAIIDDAGIAAVVSVAEYAGLLQGLPVAVVEVPGVADVADTKTVAAAPAPQQDVADAADGIGLTDSTDSIDTTAVAGATSLPEQRTCGPDDLAYILFTSGSTGKPKGVMQNHRNVLHHVRTYSNALHITANDRLSLFSSYGFDASVMDIFGALLNGACLYPLDIRNQAHPGELLDQMGSGEATSPQGITVLHATPTVFRFLMRHKVCRHDLSAVRLVVLGGEEARAADFALFKRHFAPPALFVNGLGPSESTLATQFFADHQTHLPGQIVPVGRAVSDTDIVLLNEDGTRAGISGEIAIVSRYVSTGYWQQPELTCEKFLADPLAAMPDRRLYRSGDRARLLPDGQLVYLGRIDGQLKVRGHRIEPGEIEAQLMAADGVDRCAVVLHSQPNNGHNADVRLVAYAVLCNDETADGVDANSLRRLLRSVLPEYMLPQAIVMLDELPLMANGKVDRSALPAPDWSRGHTQIYVQPRTATERQLASIWADVLGVAKVGIHDDFFELGGHSLLAAQLVARVTESMQVGLPLRRLFDTPTIAGLAEHVDTLQWALGNQLEP